MLTKGAGGAGQMWMGVLDRCEMFWRVLSAGSWVLGTAGAAKKCARKSVLCRCWDQP
jgi:hypothetical protein